MLNNQTIKRFMKHTIEVRGIKLYAFHGCLPEEAKIGGHYEVDVMLNTDFTHAAEHDDLTQTVDYVDVNRIVTEEMLIRSKLIEHVGQRIINRIKTELQRIHNVQVTIKKLCPPIQGDVNYVSISIEG